MTRKDRTTTTDIIQNKKSLENEDDSDYNTEDDTKIDHEDKQEEYRKLSIIYETRQQLIQYINDNGLPLGQHLNQNSIEDFINQLACLRNGGTEVGGGSPDRRWSDQSKHLVQQI